MVAVPLSSWLAWGTKQPHLYPGLLAARTPAVGSPLAPEKCVDDLVNPMRK